MTSRRNFLRSTAMISAGALVAPSVISCGGGAKKSGSKKEIGIQIYTIREQLNSDLAGSLKKLSEIGYNSIEAAGFANAGGAYQFYGKSPKEFSKMLQDLGMNLLSSHTTFELDKADDVCAAHSEAGCKYIVYPFLPENLRPNIEGYKAVGEMLNKMGEAAQKHGIQLGYHNHAFEYTELEGQIPIEVMMASTDPKLVQYEIDLYWTVKAGKDPIEYFNKYPGRFELWHVKDIDNTPEKFFAPVGSGTINWEQLFAAKDKAGMKHFFVEEDRTKGDVWEDITKSYNFLNNANFVK